ncbi:MAG: FtsX-like permease family protein [Duncaniella sp.]|nr:FtsX-like permease family protein [Duncaniella sp.]
MHNLLSLRIALRYLFAKKSHSAVNVISIISTAGIAVASMAIVCVLSVFNGFSDLAAERQSAVGPDVCVTPRDGKVFDCADSLASAVGKVPGVKMVATVLSERALAVFEGVQMPVMVKGVPSPYSAVSSISTLVIDGVMIDVPSEAPDSTLDYALLSVGTAINTGARPSLERPMVLTVPRRVGRINPAFPLGAFSTDTVFVSGVYQTNEQEYDEDGILIPLHVARKLFDYPTQASALEVALQSDADTGEVVAEIERLLGGGFVVADRLRQQETAFRMIEIEKWITFLMLLFVLVMASFNILSTMSMLIIEKEDNLRVMRSMGASRSLLRRIFLDEGMLIAVLGGAVGITVGVVLCIVQQEWGLISLGGDHSQMSVVAYPCRLRGGDVALTALVVVVIGFISGFISSRSLPEK